MKLTPHFTLEEMIVSQTAIRRGINNTPPSSVVDNLRFLCQHLEVVREALGHPVYISSGYRCPDLNQAIGGSRRSSHMTGLAVDFTCPGFGSPRDIVEVIAASEMIHFDQIILEFDRWVHLSVSRDTPREQILTARMVAGKAKYYPGIAA